MTSPRQVIPAGVQDRPLKTLEPIVRLLIARGHEPVGEPHKLGFRPTPGGYVCSLRGALTAADWAAVNEHFELPPTLVFEAGTIRDHANWIDIEGSAVIE